MCERKNKIFPTDQPKFFRHGSFVFDVLLPVDRDAVASARLPETQKQQRQVVGPLANESEREVVFRFVHCLELESIMSF